MGSKGDFARASAPMKAPMNTSRPPTPADLGDRHRRFTVLAMLAAGLGFLCSSFESLWGSSQAPVLDFLEKGAMVSALALLLPMMLWKLRSPRSDWSLYRGDDGFIAETVSRAHIASWVTTLFVLLGLGFFDQRLRDLPPGPILEAVVGVMFTSFAVAFFFLDWTPPEEDLEMSDDA